MTDSNILLRIWKTTPPVTKYITLFSTLITLLVYLELANIHTLSFSSFYITKKYQFWRIITPYFYFGKLNIETALHIIFLSRYSRMLEESITSSEYLALLVYIMVTLKIVDFFVYLKLGMCLSSCITYIWTRKNPHTHVQLLGCVVFPAFYLPFIVPMFSMLSDKKVPREDIMGIVVGHVFYYFKFLWPKFRSDFLITPVWLKKVFNDYYEEDLTVKLVNRKNGGEGDNGDVMCESSDIISEVSSHENELEDFSSSIENIDGLVDKESDEM